MGSEIQVISYNNNNADILALIDQKIADSEASIRDFISVTTNDLQDQIDGKIETYYQNENPNTWPASERLSHTGDMWYITDTKALYRYDGATNSWELVRDQKIIDAYTLAALAKDTADGKRTIFGSEPYGPYSVGDLWTVAMDYPTVALRGELMKCITATNISGYFNIADWTKATKYTDDTTAKDALSQAQTAALDASYALDKAKAASNAAQLSRIIALSKTRNFINTGVGDDVPHGYHINDTWTDGVKLYLCRNTAPDADSPNPIHFLWSDWQVATEYALNSVVIDKEHGSVLAGTISVADSNGYVTGGFQGALGASGNNIGFWLGQSDPNNAPFSVTMDGTLTAKQGFIGGWQVLANSIVSATGTEWLLNGYSTSGITLAANGSIHAPNFYINQNGTVGIRGDLKTGEGATRVHIDAAANNIVCYYNSTNYVKIDSGSVTCYQDDYNKLTMGIWGLDWIGTNAGRFLIGRTGTFPNYMLEFLVQGGGGGIKMNLQGIPPYPTVNEGNGMGVGFKVLYIHQTTGRIVRQA